MSKEKKITLDCLESKEISDILSTEESNSRIHVLPMMKITLKVVNCIYKYDRGHDFLLY